jgi:beta-glucosidase/6-phospho-beta-glucosidase/beta-galactosidase/ABC-type amino acid transport substrate-binding protein
VARTLRFGVATADHQCEAFDGHDDIRDVWERVRRIVPRGRATDFWNRYREDIGLASELGCSVFRLSLSWARLEPQPGVWSDEAFAHYRDVLQAIRDAEMSAVVTLVHNTWPLHVQAAGGGAGLLDAEFPGRVERFATEVARRIGDLIDDYVTLNEPDQLVYGWIKGFWMRAYAMPPGQPPYQTGEAQMDDVLTLIPNLFRAHAKARTAIKTLHPAARVGANPLVLGLPRWLQRLIDRNATHLQSPDDAKRQAARISQSVFDQHTRVDCSIAQLTITRERLQIAFFSEPYYCTSLAILYRNTAAAPAEPQTWRGTIAVAQDTHPASVVGGWFPGATIQYVPNIEAAVTALQHGKIDAVFDDAVTLRQFAGEAINLGTLPKSDQCFAIAMPLGSRSLLNVADRAIREMRKVRPDIPDMWNRKTVAHIGREREAQADDQRAMPPLDATFKRIKKRGRLRVGVHPGVAPLCERTDGLTYEGLEPDIARAMAKYIFGESRVEFVPLYGTRRLGATRTLLNALLAFRKGIAMFSTLLGTNWWNLGMAGKLPQFLCPPECVGSLDYVGLDYYWGVPSFWPRDLHRLSAASDFQYADAPVWPDALDMILREAAREFPGKPIMIIENGCVARASGVGRPDYLTEHVNQVRKALARGAPVAAYVCWSITSNREWGLPFDDGSDFGLYHIALDDDPELKRIPTDSSRTYAALIGPAESRKAKRNATPMPPSTNAVIE